MAEESHQSLEKLGAQLISPRPRGSDGRIAQVTRSGPKGRRGAARKGSKRLTCDDTSPRAERAANMCPRAHVLQIGRSGLRYNSTRASSRSEHSKRHKENQTLPWQTIHAIPVAVKPPLGGRMNLTRFRMIAVPPKLLTRGKAKMCAF